MIIRKTQLLECWCPRCGAGQMATILEKSFAEQRQLETMIGETFRCDKCGNHNTVDDIASFIVQEYLVSIESQKEKQQINQDMKKWFNADVRV